MATLKNIDVYSSDPRFPAPVLAAIQDISRQRVNRATGKLLRRLSLAIDTQIADVSAEHKRLLEAHARRDENGEPVKITTEADLVDKRALDADYEALMQETFEVDGIPDTLLENFVLQGSTWLSPIVVDASEKKEGADSPGAV